MVVSRYRRDGDGCLGNVGGHDDHATAAPLGIAEHTFLVDHIQFREEWVHRKRTDAGTLALQLGVGFASYLAQLHVIGLVEQINRRLLELVL
jgi:hypothetical protein